MDKVGLHGLVCGCFHLSIGEIQGRNRYGKSERVSAQYSLGAMLPERGDPVYRGRPLAYRQNTLSHKKTIHCNVT